jgi:uncharacterized protein (TIGR02217 family)
MYDDQVILPMELSSFGAGGGPRFNTRVTRAGGGAEYRVQLWAYELGRWTVSYDARMPITYREMFRIFRTVGGMANSFRAKDPIDFSVAGPEGKFIATSVSTEWQMVKRYSVGSSYQDRIITKPYSTATASAGSIDFDTGIVTNATMPASWSGSFYVQVRFDTDEMVPRTIDSSEGELMLAWEDIPVVEVRE